MKKRESFLWLLPLSSSLFLPIYFLLLFVNFFFIIRLQIRHRRLSNNNQEQKKKSRNLDRDDFSLIFLLLRFLSNYCFVFVIFVVVVDVAKVEGGL
jgi:hypothetical protein